MIDRTLQQLIDDEFSRPPRTLVGITVDAFRAQTIANEHRRKGRRVSTFTRTVRAGGLRSVIVLVIDMGPRRRRRQ